MDQLSPEVLDVVVQHCDPSALRNLRLVSSWTRDSSTPHVFARVQVALFDYSLRRFNQIARSQLARHVKTVIFWADCLPKLDGRQQWEEMIDYRPEIIDWRNAKRQQSAPPLPSTDEIPAYLRESEESLAMGDENRDFASLPRHRFRRDMLDRAWALYLHFLREQRDWEEDRQGFLFKEAFALLPNVHSARAIFTMLGRSMDMGEQTQDSIWTGLRKHILIGPRDWMFHNLGQTQPLKGQEAIGFRDAFSGTKPIIELDIDSVHHQPYRDLLGTTTGHGGQPDLPSHQTRYWGIVGAFRNLTRLQYVADLSYASDTIKTKLVAAELVQFLRGARQLRKLDLDFRGRLATTRSLLAPLFDGRSSEAIWPFLEQLRLVVDVELRFFVDFLQAHSTTLTNLHVASAYMEDVGQVLRQIPHILKLEHVYLSHIWHGGISDVNDSEPNLCSFSQSTDYDGAYEQAVKAYLLRTADYLPELEYEAPDSDGDSEDGLFMLDSSENDDSNDDRDVVEL